MCKVCDERKKEGKWRASITLTMEADSQANILKEAWIVVGALEGQFLSVSIGSCTIISPPLIPEVWSAGRSPTKEHHFSLVETKCNCDAPPNDCGCRPDLYDSCICKAEQLDY